MKMMMISSLVETDGWGTPAIPGGGNKGEEVVAKEEVVDVVTRGRTTPSPLPVLVIPSRRLALLPSHHILRSLEVAISEEEGRFMRTALGKTNRLHFCIDDEFF